MNLHRRLLRHSGSLAFVGLVLIFALLAGCSASGSDDGRTTSQRGGPPAAAGGPAAPGQSAGGWSCLSETGEGITAPGADPSELLGYKSKTSLSLLGGEGLDKIKDKRSSVSLKLTNDQDPNQNPLTLTEQLVEVGQEESLAVLGRGGSPTGRGGLPDTPVLSKIKDKKKRTSVLSPASGDQARLLCNLRDTVAETLSAGAGVRLGELGLIAKKKKTRKSGAADRDRASSSATGFRPGKKLRHELGRLEGPKGIMIVWEPVGETEAMNKAELIDSIASEADLEKDQVQRGMDAFIDTTTKALKKGNRVALVGFGSFSISKRSARKGRNPQTGKEIKIPAKKVVKFKPGAELSDKIK